MSGRLSLLIRVRTLPHSVLTLSVKCVLRSGERDESRRFRDRTSKLRVLRRDMPWVMEGTGRLEVYHARRVGLG